MARRRHEAHEADLHEGQDRKVSQHAVNVWLSKRLCLVSLLLGFSTAAFAKEYANIEYLCADWGPAMTLPSKSGEKPQFSDTQEEIYFLKQVTRFTRKTRLMPDLLGGGRTEDIGHGVSIYLCKMKPDGSEKTEIKELWHNPNYPIDTQGASTWMEVNVRTRKIVVSVLFVGTDVAGLWTISLDESELKQVIRPEWSREKLVGIDHPSWTPDGQWIVFAEIERGIHPNQLRIAKCDSEGKRFSYLTDGPWQEQPAVSPDGTTIVYGQVGDAKTGGLYLMDMDGKNRHPLLDPNGKLFGGTYPTWSPDGKSILFECRMIDVMSGKVLLERRPLLHGRQWSYGWPHWGKAGIVGFSINGIDLTDVELREVKKIASSKLLECSRGEECRW